MAVTEPSARSAGRVRLTAEQRQRVILKLFPLIALIVPWQGDV
jgi:hypothetical protein